MKYTCTVCSGTKTEVIPRIATDAQMVLINSAKDENLLTYLTLTDLGDTTRLEMAELIAAYAGLNVNDTTANGFPFGDCADLTDTERGVIMAVLGANIMAPTGPDTFAPDGTLTRAQAAKVIYCAMGNPVSSGTLRFSDVGDDHWAKDYVNALYNHGIITGKTGDTFVPNDLASKEDVLTWLLNGKGWTDPRTQVNSVTNVSFVADNGGIRLSYIQPTDISGIEAFEFEFQNDRGQWVRCGGRRPDANNSNSSIPIYDILPGGTYTMVRITSVCTDQTQYRSNAVEKACTLTITSTPATATPAVTFQTGTNFEIRLTGLSADAKSVVVEFAQDANGNGGGSLSETVTSGTATITKDSSSWLKDFIPGGYYHVTEILDVAVNGSTASQNIITHEGWKQITVGPSTDDSTPSNIRFEQENRSLFLKWDGQEAGDLKYKIYLTQDGGTNWTSITSTSQLLLSLDLTDAGTYNGVKIVPCINNVEDESKACVDTSIHLTIGAETGTAPTAVTFTYNETKSTEWDYTADGAGAYDYSITGLTPNTSYKMEMKTGLDATSVSGYGSSSDTNGTGSGTIGGSKLKTCVEQGYYRIHEFTNVQVGDNGKTCSYTATSRGGWQKANAGTTPTAPAVRWSSTQKGRLEWDAVSEAAKYRVSVFNGTDTTGTAAITRTPTSTYYNMQNPLMTLATETNTVYSVKVEALDASGSVLKEVGKLDSAINLTVDGAAPEYSVSVDADLKTYTITFATGTPNGLRAMFWKNGEESEYAVCSQYSALTETLTRSGQFTEGDEAHLRIFTNSETNSEQTVWNVTLTPTAVKPYTVADDGTPDVWITQDGNYFVLHWKPVTLESNEYYYVNGNNTYSQDGQWSGYSFTTWLSSVTETTNIVISKGTYGDESPVTIYTVADMVKVEDLATPTFHLTGINEGSNWGKYQLGAEAAPSGATWYLTVRTPGGSDTLLNLEPSTNGIYNVAPWEGCTAEASLRVSTPSELIGDGSEGKYGKITVQATAVAEAAITLCEEHTTVTEVSTFNQLATALNKGGIIELTEDIANTASSYVTTDTGAPALLKLNGHTLDVYGIQVKNGKQLEIDGGLTNEIVRGTITCSSELKLERINYFSVRNTIVNGRIGQAQYPHRGAAVMENVTINYAGGTNSGQAIAFVCCNSVTLNNVDMNATGNANDGLYINGASRVEISGGTYIYSSTANNSSAAINLNNCSNITLTGVTANSVKSALKAYECSGLIVNDGSFTSDDGDDTQNNFLEQALTIYSTTGVEISGAVISGKNYSLYANGTCSIVLNDVMVSGQENVPSQCTLVIQCGTFSFDPSGYVDAEHYNVIENEDGTFTVEGQ